MAQNPFYPGYTPQKPGQTSSNPFYSGYYPGKKLPKGQIRSSGAKIPVKTGSGASQIIEEQMDEVIDGISEMINIPGWIKDRMADDISQALKITVRPPELNTDFSEDTYTDLLLDEYSTSATYGAGFLQLNVDPRAWKKEGAKKMIKKTLTGWAKSIFNESDFENYAAQHYWTNLLTTQEIRPGVREIGEGLSIADSIAQEERKRRERLNKDIDAKNKKIEEQNNALDADYEKRLQERQEEIRRVEEDNKILTDENALRATRGEEPLPLKPLPTGEIPKPVHAPLLPRFSVAEFERPARGTKTIRNPFAFDPKGDYRSAATNLASYFPRAGSPITRNKHFDEASQEILSAVSKDLGKRKKDTSGATAEAIESFTTRQNIANNIGSVSAAKAKVNGSLEAIMLNGHLDIQGVDANGSPIVPQALVTLHSQLETLKKKNDALKQMLGDKATRDMLEKKYGSAWVKALENQVNAISEVTSSDLFNGMMTGRVDRKSAGTILQQLSRTQGNVGVIVGRDLTGGDIFCPSYERKMNRDLLEELGDENSELNRYLTTTDSEANKLMYFLPAFFYEQDSETFTEFAEKLQSGFAERFIWTQRFGKFTVSGFHYYTPRDLYKWALNKVQNFGMVIDEEGLRRTKWYKRAVEMGIGPKGIFANNFSIRLADKKGNPFEFEGENGGKVKIFKIKTWGGEHYNAISQLKGGLITGVNLTQNSTFVKLFLVDGKKLSDFGKWVDGKFEITATGLDKNTLDLLTLITANDKLNQEKIENFFRNVDKFREFVNKNILTKLGIKNTEEFWKKLVSGLGNIKLTSITRRYMGLMERLSFAVRRFQENLYEKVPLVRFVYSKIFLAKRAIKNLALAVKKAINKFFKKVSDAIVKRLTKVIEKFAEKALMRSIATGLSQLAGSLIPFIGNLIAFALSWLVEKVLTKALEAVKNFVKMMWKLSRGEFTAAIESMEKNYQKTVKKVLTILMILAIFHSSFTLMAPEIIPSPSDVVSLDPVGDLYPFLMTTFSPVDETRQYGSIKQDFNWNLNIGINPATGLPYNTYVTTEESAGEGYTIDCSGPKTMPPQVNGNLITNHAYAIANDLERGFWCLFNHSPTLYPDLWDSARYASDPNLIGYNRNDASYIRTLFWCTWMVIKTQQTTYDFFQDLTGTCTMPYFIINNNPYNITYTMRNRANTPLSDIKPGSIIFYGRGGGDITTGMCADHVGLVYSITTGGIYTIESNASDVSFFIPTECAGSSCPLTDRGIMSILGYAIPND